MLLAWLRRLFHKSPCAVHDLPPLVAWRNGIWTCGRCKKQFEARPYGNATDWKEVKVPCS